MRKPKPGRPQESSAAQGQDGAGVIVKVLTAIGATPEVDVALRGTASSILHAATNVVMVPLQAASDPVPIGYLLVVDLEEEMKLLSKLKNPKRRIDSSKTTS